MPLLLVAKLSFLANSYKSINILFDNVRRGLISKNVHLDIGILKSKSNVFYGYKKC